MNRFTFFGNMLLVALLRLGPPAFGQAPLLTSPSDLAFLEIGNTYVITFPEDRHPVKLLESGITPQPSGAPSSWRARFLVDQFVVRKLGGGSWVLLEHPVDPKESVDVMSARILLGDKAKLAELEADPSKKKFLEGRREVARRELKTRQTWINLAQAISISDPPTDVRWEVKINAEVK
jgi:hypothetical protein